jgi:hypothetical protein
MPMTFLVLSLEEAWVVWEVWDFHLGEVEVVEEGKAIHLDLVDINN